MCPPAVVTGLMVAGTLFSTYSAYSQQQAANKAAAAREAAARKEAEELRRRRAAEIDQNNTQRRLEAAEAEAVLAASGADLGGSRVLADMDDALELDRDQDIRNANEELRVGFANAAIEGQQGTGSAFAAAAGPLLRGSTSVARRWEKYSS